MQNNIGKTDLANRMPRLTFDNLNFVNCDQSGYVECRVAYWMWRVIPIVLVAFGVIGNTLNIAVLCRKQLRKNSTCIYLLFLAVSDTTLLGSGPLVKMIKNISGIDIYSLSALNCSLSDWIIHSAGSISCWLIVLITVERTMVTLFPTQAKPKMTPRNAIIAPISLVIFVAGFNGHMLYGYIIEDIKINMTLDNETMEEHVKSCIIRPGGYAEFYNEAYGIMLTITSIVLPMSLIVTGNTIVGIALIKRKRALQRIEANDQNSINIPSRRSGKDLNTKIFFVLCAVFIVTTLPYGLYASRFEFNKEVDDHTFAKYQLINIVTRSVLWCNFSFNFLLYFMTGSLFKKEFKDMIDGLYKSFQILAGKCSVNQTNGNDERY